MYTFDLAGCRHRPIECQAEVLTLRPGDELSLVRDPNNEYDHNAIQVCSKRTNAHLGFVPRQTAARLAPEMDNEREEYRCVVRISGDKTPTLAVDVASSPDWERINKPFIEQLKDSFDEVPF